VFKQRAQGVIAKDMDNLMDKLTEEHAKAASDSGQEGVHRATFWMDSALKIDHMYTKETEKKLFIKEKIEGKKYPDGYKHYEEKDVDTESYDEKFEEGFILLNKDKLEFRLSAKDKYLSLPDKYESIDISKVIDITVFKNTSLVSITALKDTLIIVYDDKSELL
jgi:hypothetical protein